MDRSNSMSLTVLVIVLALLGLLVGYLLGNWFIQLVTGDSPGMPQLLDDGNKVVEEEIVLEDEETEESMADNYFLGANSETAGNDSVNDDYYSQSSQIQSEEVFVIQVGAFNSRKNAEELRNELSLKGFQTVIADESIPYKVQIGAFTNRDQAEEIEKEVKTLGYEAFITH